MLKEFHLERCCPGRDWLQFRAFELLSPRPLTAFVIMGLEAGKVAKYLKVYENHTISDPLLKGFRRHTKIFFHLPTLCTKSRRIVETGHRAGTSACLSSE